MRKKKKQEQNERKQAIKQQLGRGLKIAYAVLIGILLITVLPTRMSMLAVGVNKAFMVISALLFAAVIGFVLVQKETKYKKWFAFFTSGLLLYIGLSLSVWLHTEYDFLLKIRTFTEELRLFFMVAIIGTGLTLVYLFKEKTDVFEQSVADNKIPKNKRISLIILTLLVILGGSMYLYKNAHFDVFEDEFQMMGIGKGFAESGELLMWDFATDSITESKYGVWPHSKMLGYAFRLFGDSPQVGRMLSGVLGILFLIIFYFIANYFIRNRAVVLFALFLLIININYLHLFRYIRMYALLIPLIQVILLLILKAIVEKNTIKQIANFAPVRWLNFNYLYLLLSLVLIYVAYSTHQIALVVVPAAFIFLILTYAVEHEKRYRNAILAGVGIIVFISLFYSYLIPTHVLTAFEGRDYKYLAWLGAYPILAEFSFAVLVIGVVHSLFMRKKIDVKPELLLWSLMGFTLLFFVFIVRYKGHDFRFVSHVVPWVILLVALYVFRLFRLVFSKYIAVVLMLLVLSGAALSQFNEGYKEIYVHHPYRPQYAEAYQLITDNFDVEKDVLLGQYFKSYYGRELLQKNITAISMQSNKKYSYEQFLSDINQHGQGWVTWANYKGYHLQPKIINYVYNNFRQYAGQGLDSTNMAVFYFDRTMIPGSAEHTTLNRNMFAMNLWLEYDKPFAVSVRFRHNGGTSGIVPFNFRGKPTTSGILLTEKGTEANLKWVFGTQNNFTELAQPLKIGTTEHITLTWQPTGAGGNAQIYHNGILSAEAAISNTPLGEDRLFLAKNFTGNIYDVAIYKRPLTETDITNLSTGKYLQKGKINAEHKPYRQYTLNNNIN